MPAVLIDNCDSERPGDRGIILCDVWPLDHQRPGVGHHCAGNDFDQRAFPGAIFVDKRVNLTRTQVEIDAFQGVNAAKVFLMDLASSSIDLFRRIELFGHRMRMFYNHPVLRVNAAVCRQPPIRRNSKQSAAVDHLPA